MDEATEATEAMMVTMEAVEEVTGATADLAGSGQVRGALKALCFDSLFLMYRQVQQRNARTWRLYRRDHRGCRGGHSCNCSFGDNLGKGKGRIKTSLGIHDMSEHIIHQVAKALAAM